MISRRNFLGFLVAATAAPAIVRVASLMPVRVPLVIPAEPMLWPTTAISGFCEMQADHLADAMRYGMSAWHYNEGSHVTFRRIDPVEFYVAPGRRA